MEAELEAAGVPWTPGRPIPSWPGAATDDTRCRNCGFAGSSRLRLRPRAYTHYTHRFGRDPHRRRRHPSLGPRRRLARRGRAPRRNRHRHRRPGVPILRCGRCGAPWKRRHPEYGAAAGPVAVIDTEAYLVRLVSPLDGAIERIVRREVEPREVTDAVYEAHLEGIVDLAVQAGAPTEQADFIRRMWRDYTPEPRLSPSFAPSTSTRPGTSGWRNTR